MKINLTFPNINFNSVQKKSYPKLSQLKFDTVSFSAMKKTQFSGIDLMMINRLKAPIEKFNTNDDFQAWCKNKVQNEYISKKDELVESVDPQAQIQKEKILSDWIEYITVENEAYTPAIQLMILSSITSDLSNDTNHLPPVLDKRILADTIYEITQNCKKDKNYNPNFNKLYRNKLQTGIMQEETNLDTSLSGWIVIPSKENDPNNFEENVKKLQTLSHDHWCTKTYNAEPYLAEGDFHIYMEEGKPKLGVRFDGQKIAEIQGEKNNSKIPLNCLDIAKSYIKENKFILSGKANKEFKNAERTRTKVNNVIKRLTEQGLNLKTCSTTDIFDALEIKYEENEDGKLIVENYRQPDKNITYEELGINENRLFEDIVEIKGDVDFGDSDVTNLGSLKTIAGSVNFENSQVTNLGDLETIQNDAVFSFSKLTDLGKLKNIGGLAYFHDSKIANLGDLETIGGDTEFSRSPITSLGKLKSIGGVAWFGFSKITDLGSLEEIAGSAYFQFSEITSLNKLKIIRGDADFACSKITDLGDLEIIGGCANFGETPKVKSLGKLKSINGKSIGNAKTPEDLAS